MNGFGEKMMEKALDAAASGQGNFIAGERKISYGGGSSYDWKYGNTKPSGSKVKPNGGGSSYDGKYGDM